MSTIAIITARGGSKRIPRKNIKSFAGKPMLAYAIQAAKESAIFDEIMVSTEDVEIAQIALEYGADVPFMRSAKTASDYATTCDVLEEVLSEYRKRGREFDVFCCIYPCVPFLSGSVLRDAHQKMGTHDAVIPVCAYPVPVEWAFDMEENGALRPRHKVAQTKRSQDLKDAYYDAGMFYFCKTEALFSQHTVVPDGTLGSPISEILCQDIDTPNDWAMAEMKYSILHQKKP